MKKRTLFLYGLLLLAPVAGNAQCSQYPTLELGNDTVLCSGTTYSLLVQDDYDNYHWSTGSTLNGINISTSGTYNLQVVNVGTNIVLNGDFELGNQDFTSSYVYGPGGPWGLLSNEGTYAVSTSPSNVHTNFSSCNDHTTTGPGNMLIANGSGTPNTPVWCQTVTVTPGTDYMFSAWVGNALNDPNVSNLQFFVNNAQLGTVFSTSVNACNWTQFFEVWNSGIETTAELCIRNQNTVGSGNDFVLDDISFAPVCVQEDSIVVVYDTLTISAGPDILFCENESENLTATSNIPGTQFLWETGNAGSTLTPPSTGMYTVHAISANGCFAEDSAQATITPMPWDIDTTISGPTSCGSTDGYVSVIPNGTFNTPPLYTWSGPGPNSPNEINASVWENIPVGWYYVTIESGGCFRYDSALVTPLNPPIADMTANPLTGDAPLTVDFTNSSINGISYEWIFGNGNTINATDLSGQSQVYDTPGTYTAALVVTNGACTDTAYATIIVTVVPPDPPEPPHIPEVPVDVEAPNVFTPNADGKNDLFVLELLNIKSVELIILNRWGNTVFTSEGVSATWDGKTKNGADATNGVYFYRYKAIGAQDEEINGHGMVELIRP